MAKDNFELKGMEQLRAKLNQMSVKVDKSTENKALKAGAEKTKEKIETHPNFPVSDLPKEHAQDNVVVVEKKEGKYEVGVHKDFFYVLFREIGAEGGLYMGKQDWNKDIPYVTPDIDAKPFFRPAFEGSIDEIQDAMADVIKRDLGL